MYKSMSRLTQQSSVDRPRQKDNKHHCAASTTTPQGPPVVLIFFVTVCVARSTTETSFDGPLAVNNSFASGENAMPQGRCPTSNDPVGALVAVSTIKTLCPRPVLTYSFDASGESSRNIGLISPGVPSLIG